MHPIQMDIEMAKQQAVQPKSPERSWRHNNGPLTESKQKEEPSTDKKKTIFGKKRDQSQPAQRVTGASKLIKKIQTKEGRDPNRRK